MAAESKNQILSLTGLRFFAAAIVVMFHFARPLNAGLLNFISHGAVGVMVFFVLSGFILTYSYSQEPGVVRGDLKSFWVARFARLYPVYLLGVLLFAPIIIVAGDAPTWHRAVTGFLALTVLQSWFHPLGLSWGMWNPPGWSLSAEMFFYLVFPLACIKLSKLPTRRLGLIAVLCWALSVFGMSMHSIMHLTEYDLWAFLPLVRLPEFLLGMAAGLIWKRRTTLTFDRMAPYTAIAAVVAFIAIMCLPVNDKMFFSGFLSPIAALLICSLACGRGVLVRMMSSRPIVLLGGASYSLYILHWPFWRLGRYFFGGSRLATQQPDLYFVLYFVVTTIAACVCFLCLEEPMNRLLRRKLMGAPSTSRHAESGAASASGLSDVLAFDATSARSQ
jgi:peptidoglycan/LPS O-acetylase OafA/YrhL